jgi:hypothetical protein
MDGKWFSNRGQVVQILIAVLSTSTALISLYFVLKSNNSLPKASIILYVSGGILLLVIGFTLGRRSVSSYTTKPKKKPRIRFLKVEYIHMLPGIGSHGVYRSTPGSGDANGIAATFRNDDANVKAYGVRANARYRDVNGEEIGSGVSGLLWLDKGREIVDLPPDESRALVILLDKKEQGSGVPWTEKLQQFPRASLPRFFQSEIFPATVEIRLRDRDSDLLFDGPIVLEIKRNDGELLATRV